MKLTKNFYINITDSESLKTKSMSLSKLSIISIFALFLAFIGFAGFATYFTYFKIVDSNKITELEQENKKLMNQMDQFSENLDSINVKVEKNEKWEDKIREKHDLKRISPDLRKVGTGGYPDIDSTFIDNSALHTKFNELRMKFSKINNKLNFDNQTYEKLYDFVEQKRSLYDYLPSIYPTFGRVTSAFGYRYHPILKKKAFHSGLDFGNAIGTPIYATANGTVVKTGNKRLLGKYILIKHKYGYKTKYGHLNEIGVKPGQKITKGEIIGKMGNTGRSTGPHLHYELARYGKLKNPWNYLKKVPHEILTSSL